MSFYFLLSRSQKISLRRKILNSLEKEAVDFGGMARRKGIFKIRGIEWTVEGEKKYSSQNSYKITEEEGTILPSLF